MCLLSLIWAGKQPRCSWDTLTLPFERGGFEAPDICLYYLCAQAQFAHYWLFPQKYMPHLEVKADEVHPIPLPAKILHRGVSGN